MRRVWQYDFSAVGNGKIWWSLSVLSVLEKARPLFASVFARKRTYEANLCTASNNLALRSLYRLDVGQSENVGARGNWSVAKRDSKSFRWNQSERGAHGKTALSVFGCRCAKRGLSKTKRCSHALSRRLERENERF